jgi:hypothetical protein
VPAISPGSATCGSRVQGNDACSNLFQKNSKWNLFILCTYMYCIRNAFKMYLFACVVKQLFFLWMILWLRYINMD